MRKSIRKKDIRQHAETEDTSETVRISIIISFTASQLATH